MTSEVIPISNVYGSVWFFFEFKSTDDTAAKNLMWLEPILPEV